MSIIPSGSIQKNASELILNDRLAECISYVCDKYDLIIIDSAPTEMITDSFVISQLCDFTIYAVRHNYTPKILLKRFDKNQALNPLKNVSIVFNSVKSKGYFNNEYGYGYKYTYSGKNKEYYMDK
jgi:Mrp family chromosome partitioning ATPase